MSRVITLVAALGFAAFAVWHPVPHSALQFGAERPAQPPAARAKHRHGSSAATPGDGSIVYVVGAVARPGLYRVGATARVDDAVRKAGGLLPGADPAGVNLASHVADGDEINVPRLGEPGAAPRLHRGRSKRKKAHANVTTPIDLNSADASALARVPGIGASIAARIVEVREHDGVFASLDQLLDVAGMSPRRLDLAQPYLYVR